MKTEELVKEISKLNVDEKISLVEDIWDSIADAIEDVPMPDWQINELDKRYESYKNGEQPLFDCHDLHNALREKHK